MRVVLGVTGCIGAYKTPEIVRRLRDAGADVRVVLTRAGSWFVTEGALQTVSGHPVYVDLFRPRTVRGVEHVDVAREADLFLIAPATANILAKMAAGLADDFLSTSLLAYGGPILVAPAMNTGMYRHPAVQANLATLAARGVDFVGPEDGDLACGDVGTGRLAAPEAIVSAVVARLQGRTAGLLAGRRVLVTSGPTREPIDPVRFISNPSSGRMGHALAREARRQGAEVTLVTGPTARPVPDDVRAVPVLTVDQMRRAVLEHAGKVDAVFMAAAVGDWAPEKPASRKMKKGDGSLVLELRRTPDILAELGAGRRRGAPPVLVGFAAETDHEVEHARAKLERKNLDLVVANRVDAPGSGFLAETNRVTLVGPDGQVERWPLLAKDEVASRLVQWLADRLRPVATAEAGDAAE